MLRASCLCVLAAWMPVVAQTPPPDFDATEKRAIEWSVLAGNLEQRLARLLPCDARALAAIDEVSRTSEARVSSLTAYWQAAAASSREQIEASRSLLTRQEASATARKDDVGDVAEETAAFSERSAQLADGARNSAALQAAKNALDRIAQASEQAAGQARERTAASEGLVRALRENLAANQARQSAVQDAIKTLAEEGQRWHAYYAARAARAQTECEITEQTATPVSSGATKSASKKAAPAKKSAATKEQP